MPKSAFVLIKAEDPQKENVISTLRSLARAKTEIAGVFTFTGEYACCLLVAEKNEDAIWKFLCHNIYPFIYGVMSVHVLFVEEGLLYDSDQTGFVAPFGGSRSS